MLCGGCVCLFLLARCAHCAVTFLSSLGDQSSPSLSTSVSVWNKVEPNLFHSVTESNIINNILCNISLLGAPPRWLWALQALTLKRAGKRSSVDTNLNIYNMCVMPILQVPRDRILYLGALFFPMNIL